MEITRKADLKTVDGPADYFTGKVTITGQFQRPSRRASAAPSSTSSPAHAPHGTSHPAGQTLIVTEGVGWTQVEGGPKLEFHAGDVLWCPAEHKHWHGATPHEAMTHIAIQEVGERHARDLDGEGHRRAISRSAWQGLIPQDRCSCAPHRRKHRKVRTMILDETFTLSNGVTIPKLGFGTWRIPDDDAVRASARRSLLGYRHIDTAQAYANERGVGEAVRSSGVAARPDLRHQQAGSREQELRRTQASASMDPCRRSGSITSTSC